MPLLAMRYGATLILRLDDTDAERSTKTYADAILEDLEWLGIGWQRLERQSARIARYANALDGLKDAGLVYPAYETPEELDRKRRLQQARGLPPVYDRAALLLDDGRRAEMEARGRKPHWRLKLSGTTVRWEDGVRGAAHIETSSLSDPVLVRGDGTVLYTFASVVDDIDMGVTHVVRGEDHVANTAIQIELFAALGVAPPDFAHHNLIATTTGEEMSKRKGSLSLRSFRDAGVDPMAVASVAVLTGSSEAVRPIATLRALAEIFGLSKLSRALTRFDPAEILQISARLLHEKPFDAVSSDLYRQGIAGANAEPFWAAIRSNIDRVDDAAVWWTVATDRMHATTATMLPEDRAYIAAARAALPDEPFDGTSWSLWTERLKTETGRKGRALFLPLRLALTGHEHGPELKLLLPIMGRALCSYRLSAHLPEASSAEGSR